MSGYLFIKQVLSDTMAEDLQWLSHGRVPGQKPDPVYNPWMPFQMAEFVALLAECVAYSEGRVFLDVGSGVGTKVQVAKILFGLEAYGIEYDQDMMVHATGKERTTILADALTCNPEHYWNADIIWMYRPFRDSLQQAKLEHRIFELMKPGAIIAGAQWENAPNGFEIIVDDWEIGHRGAFKKPLGWETESIDIDMDEADD